MQFTTKTAEQEQSLKVIFYFDDDDKESGVELQLITDEMRQKAQKTLVKDEIEFAIHPKTNKLTKVVTPEFETKKLEAWFLDNLITSWWGLYLDKKELKCTKANKVKLYKGQKVFRDFIDDCHNQLKDMADETFGGSSTEKNS